MKKGYLLLLWIGLAGLMIIASACSPSRVPVNEYNGNPTSAPANQVQPTSPSDNSSAETDQQPEQPSEPSESEGGVPDDVPIMEGGYDVQSARKGQNINYQIDTEIEDVVKFYQDELPNYGWSIEGPPDTHVGSIATMSRENDAGDTLAVNLQFNQLGGFVRVQISISRSE